MNELSPIPSRSKPLRPVVLCILDGWGWRPDAKDNAIMAAKTPVYDRLTETAPKALIATSGLSVGLPDGQMGNSEVGHMNIGAGRVVMQDLPRIDAAIADGSLAENKELGKLINSVRATDGAVHLLGLLSPGGVHSHQAHIAAIARILDKAGVRVFIHAILDGRDTPPKSAEGFIRALQNDIDGTNGVSIATLTGRFYAMDRDKRWDRVENAYRAIVLGQGKPANDALSALRDAYRADESDEFVTPRIIAGYEGARNGDAILMANFRADRAREIMHALIDTEFNGFTRNAHPNFCTALGMTEYSADLARLMPAIFPPEDLQDTLGDWVAKSGLKQLRIAETEKYAHVTFFLNGGREDAFDGEERELIPSPKVETYDLQPEMSAPELTEKLCNAIASGKFDLIVVNFANPDMVGHTGIFDAAVTAVETVDTSLGRLETAIAEAGGVMLVTADHGNIELMRDQKTNEPHTAHTTFDVPLLLVNAAALDTPVALKDGRLCDLAPTVLTLMGLEQPGAMTGTSLLTPALADANA